MKLRGPITTYDPREPHQLNTSQVHHAHMQVSRDHCKGEKSLSCLVPEVLDVTKKVNSAISERFFQNPRGFKESMSSLKLYGKEFFISLGALCREGNLELSLDCHMALGLETDFL